MGAFPNILFYLSVAAFVAGWLYCFLSFRDLQFWLSARDMVQISKSSKLKLTVLVPVRDEADNVSDSVRYFANWLAESSSPVDVRLFFVSAIDRVSTQHPTTRQVVEQTLSDILTETPQLAGKFAHLHCSNPDTSKANQVNWAVSKIFEGKKQNEKETLIGLYDVDARPSNKVLQFLTNAEGSFPECLQQFTIYYSARGRGQNVTVWGQLAAMWQSRFSLLVEAFVLNRPSLMGVRTLRWTIGNGFYMRLDSFNKLEGLSENHEVEDIELGFRLSLEDIPIQRIPIFLESGNPDSIADDISQKQRWFRGIWHYLEYARDARGTGKFRLAKILAAQGILRGLGWVSFGPLILFVLVYGVVFVDGIVGGLLGFSGVIYVIFAAILSEKIVVSLEELPIVQGQISQFHQRVLRITLAPIYAVAFSLAPISELALSLARSFSPRRISWSASK